MTGQWVETARLFVEAGGFSVAIFTAWQGLKKAHEDRKDALDQAKRDLQWRQTVEAQKAVRRLVGDPRAQNAMIMLDWSDREFEIAPDQTDTISFVERQNALRTDPEIFDAKEMFIRDCFDALFDQFQMIQQEINNKLFDVEHVYYPVAYFSRLMWLPTDRPVIQAFLEKYGYPLAKDLIEATHSHSSVAADVATTPRAALQ
jgi:hypothetical protein